MNISPIEIQKLKETMTQVSQGIDKVFNRDKPEGSPRVGFVLLVFPLGDTTGKCHYASNGASPKDIMRIFKVQLKKLREKIHHDRPRPH